MIVDGSAFVRVDTESFHAQILSDSDFIVFVNDFLVDRLDMKLIHYFGTDTAITVNPAVQIIGNSCFAQSVLPITVSFAKGSKLTRIERAAFMSSNLREIALPTSIEVLEASSFQGCSRLNSVVFDAPSNLRSIGKNSFAHTALARITVQVPTPSSVSLDAPGCDIHLVEL
jgi:hypothetical protein